MPILELSDADFGFIVSFDPDEKENFWTDVLADFIDAVQMIIDEAPQLERKDFK